MTSNYQFLEMLHRELKPRGYLEIGVRHGDSLRLAQCPAIGIDPEHHVSNVPAGIHLYPLTSDQFFDTHASTVLADFGMDLVYIDGMHLYEHALRDFVNVARWANERTVVVFDDTHPYNQAIATRAQPPGDWTGDVWKTMDLLESELLNTLKAQVDVSPTGAFVVWDLDEVDVEELRATMTTLAGPPFTDDLPVPSDIIDRANTIPPEEVIQQILRSRT